MEVWTKLCENDFHYDEYGGTEQSYAKVAFIVQETKVQTNTNNDKLQNINILKNGKIHTHIKNHNLNQLINNKT